MSDTQQTAPSATTKLEKLFWGIGLLIVAIGVLGTSILTALAGLAILPITGKLLKDKLKVKKPILIQSIVLIAVLLVGTFSADTTTPSEVTTAPTPAVTSAFDIPSLIGKTVSELETTLGTPTKYTIPPTANVDGSKIETWEKTWEKNEHSLMVTYNLDTNEVVDLFLSTDSDSAFANFKSKDNILLVGNLSADSTDYELEFVETMNTSDTGYTGVIIKAKK
jgi:hypothetical protein